VTAARSPSSSVAWDVRPAAAQLSPASAAAVELVSPPPWLSKNSIEHAPGLTTEDKDSLGHRLDEG
jgi:hypothetical protein